MQNEFLVLLAVFNQCSTLLLALLPLSLFPLSFPSFSPDCSHVSFFSAWQTVEALTALSRLRTLMFSIFRFRFLINLQQPQTVNPPSKSATWPHPAETCRQTHTHTHIHSHNVGYYLTNYIKLLFLYEQSRQTKAKAEAGERGKREGGSRTRNRLAITASYTNRGSSSARTD